MKSARTLILSFIVMLVAVCSETTLAQNRVLQPRLTPYQQFRVAAARPHPITRVIVSPPQSTRPPLMFISPQLPNVYRTVKPGATGEVQMQRLQSAANSMLQETQDAVRRLGVPFSAQHWIPTRVIPGHANPPRSIPGYWVGRRYIPGRYITGGYTPSRVIWGHWE
jgi:hypothetical protein